MTAKTWAIAVARPEAVRPWDDLLSMAVGMASVIRDYSVLQQSRAYIDMLSSAMNNDNEVTLPST